MVRKITGVSAVKTTVAMATLALAAFTTTAQAQTATNTMTNIVTVTDACDIVAVGVDFGVTTAPIPGGGVTSAIANTTAGNLLTGNAEHPNAGDDGGAGNDDVLALPLPLPLVSTALSLVLNAIDLAVPGVYVACSVSPSAVTVTSAAAGATPYSLPTTNGGIPTGSFSGQLGGVGGGATGTDAIDYSLAFTGLTIDLSTVPLASVYVGAFTALGTIPAAQSGSVVPGFYTDAAIAQVDF